MRSKHLFITTALVTPALFLALASCSDSNQNPASPGAPSPTVPTSAASGVNDHKLRIPQAPAAAVAEAERADAAEADLKLMAPSTAFALGPIAAHDPTRSGMRTRCLDGAEFGFGPGTSDPFLAPKDHGCELNTLAGGAAIALPYANQTRGRRVKNVTRLEFWYAGGPQNGGAPRFSLFTDFCRVPVTVTTTTNNTRSCGSGGSTDGTWDETLFIDVNGCNDGDPYVGAVLVKTSPNSKTDATCAIFETYGPDGIANNGDEHVHTNWADYLSAHPDDRFAVNTGDPKQVMDNFIIADVPVHYLVYRIRMTATGG
ncbi:MAG: hypothetical protein QOH59_1432 [Gemmatimonadales bacterium]|nr:hypothetical protein [Gemmatimonadales bacterium]